MFNVDAIFIAVVHLLCEIVCRASVNKDVNIIVYTVLRRNRIRMHVLLLSSTLPLNISFSFSLSLSLSLCAKRNTDSHYYHDMTLIRNGRQSHGTRDASSTVCSNVFLEPDIACLRLMVSRSTEWMHASLLNSSRRKRRWTDVVETVATNIRAIL